MATSFRTNMLAKDSFSWGFSSFYYKEGGGLSISWLFFLSSSFFLMCLLYNTFIAYFWLPSLEVSKPRYTSAKEPFPSSYLSSYWLICSKPLNERLDWAEWLFITLCSRSQKPNYPPPYEFFLDRLTDLADASIHECQKAYWSYQIWSRVCRGKEGRDLSDPSILGDQAPIERVVLNFKDLTISFLLMQLAELSCVLIWKELLTHYLNQENVWMLVSVVVAGMTRSSRFTSSSCISYKWLIIPVMQCERAVKYDAHWQQGVAVLSSHGQRLFKSLIVYEFSYLLQIFFEWLVSRNTNTCSCSNGQDQAELLESSGIVSRLHQQLQLHLIF